MELMLAVVVVAIVLEPMLCDSILLSLAHLIFVFYVTMISFFSGFYIVYCFYNSDLDYSANIIPFLFMLQ